MDYLNGLPMDYPKWTTLKIAANINLTELEPKQKDAIDKHNYGTLSHLRFNRLNPQLDLCHKILKGSKVETARILTSCPFAANERVVNTQINGVVVAPRVAILTCITTADQNIGKLRGAASA